MSSRATDHSCRFRPCRVIGVFRIPGPCDLRCAQRRHGKGRLELGHLVGLAQENLGPFGMGAGQHPGFVAAAGEGHGDAGPKGSHDRPRSTHPGPTERAFPRSRQISCSDSWLPLHPVPSLGLCFIQHCIHPLEHLILVPIIHPSPAFFTAHGLRRLLESLFLGHCRLGQVPIDFESSVKHTDDVDPTSPSYEVCDAVVPVNK